MGVWACSLAADERCKADMAGRRCRVGAVGMVVWQAVRRERILALPLSRKKRGRVARHKSCVCNSMCACVCSRGEREGWREVLLWTHYCTRCRGGEQEMQARKQR